ncbi:hypothetical protein MTO96_029258 [Rhipicephalus appendiculatus]
MRPRGGLVRLLKYGSAYLADVILSAAGVSPDSAGEDVITMNSKQHTILVATVSAERKRKYADLKLLVFEGEKGRNDYVRRYAGGLRERRRAREVPLTFSDAEILKRLQTYGNPPVLGVRRLGKTSRTVLILFEDKEVPRWVRLTPVAQRCVIYRKKYEVCITCGRLGHRDDVCPDPANVKRRGCGMEQPPQDHSCEPKCQLCGKGHPLGDKKCKELYRVPYEVKKKQWERKIMQQQQQLQRQQEAEETAEVNPRSRSKERHGNKDFRARNDSFPRLAETTEGQQQRGRSSSRTGGRSGSRPRERTSSRGPAHPGTSKRSQSSDQNSPAWIPARPSVIEMAKRRSTRKKKVSLEFRFTQKFADLLSGESATTGIEFDFLNGKELRCRIVDSTKAQSHIGGLDNDSASESSSDDEEADNSKSFILKLEDDPEEDENGTKWQRLLLKAFRGLAGFLKKLICWVFDKILDFKG